MAGAGGRLWKGFPSYSRPPERKWYDYSPPWYPRVEYKLCPTCQGAGKVRT